jgi:4-amino-4-deoxy-L-arabinose transferase-like glycosyltransferase
LGALALLLLMASPHSWKSTLWLGVGALACTIAGLLNALSLSSQYNSSPSILFPYDGERPIWSLPRYTLSVSLAILGLGLLILCVTGNSLEALPWLIVVALLPLAINAWFSSGWLVFFIASMVLLPALGTFGLSDPWETHYGEVAREILARDDWISLWWAQDNWFWSKPILIFWLEALSMGLFGINAQPDGNPAYPEWAVRFPHYVLSVTALLSVYLLVRRYWSNRTGVLCALVLLTCPYYFLISHQAITDLPLVTLMTISVCLLSFGLTEDPQNQATLYRFGPFVGSAQHVLIAAVSAVAIPQILYLASRNLHVGWDGFFFQYDTFLYGSAGNSGVLGNPVHQTMTPVYRAWPLQPIAQAAYWLVGYSAVLRILRRERHTQALYMYGFYLCCALGLMAKGLPGVLLPGIISLFYLLTAKRWQLLTEGTLRIGSGTLLVLVCGLPWFLAMHIRHGSGFLDRILVHDHLNRLASGVHGDTGTIQYFIEQLGTGLFPWVALVPAAIAYGLHRVNHLDAVTDPRQRIQNHILLIWGLWLVCGFALFSAMITKFHHYAFPVVPAAAFLTGIVFDRLLAQDLSSRSLRHAAAIGIIGLGAIGAVIAVAGWFGQVRGVIPLHIPTTERGDYILAHPWKLWLSSSLFAVAIACVGLGYRWMKSQTPIGLENNRFAYTAALGIGIILLAFVGRDVSWATDARPAGYERFMWLFIYRYERPWPTYLDYRPILSGFSIVFVLLLLLALFKHVRTVALYGFLLLSICFALWGLDIYLNDAGAHWTQRKIIKRYYALRKGPQEPLVSWQMNWKGETFYTGNRIPAILELTDKQTIAWLKAHQHQRVFFVLEPSRLMSLKRKIQRPVIERSTTDDCNKFILVSVEGIKPNHSAELP